MLWKKGFILYPCLKKHYFFIKSFKSKKKLPLLGQSRNMIGQFKKIYLHRPIKIIIFLCENSKMYKITSKYFSFLNNKPPASWVAHVTRDFLTCYSCVYYVFMFKGSNFNLHISAYWLLKADFIFALLVVEISGTTWPMNDNEWRSPWSIASQLISPSHNNLSVF